MENTSTRPFAYSALGRCAQEGESVITQLMADKLANPQILSLAAGFTDNRVLPQKLVEEAIRVLGDQTDPAHLQYGMNRGRPGLREAVVELLQSYPGEEEMALGPDEVVITNGSQQGLYILVQMLCEPGDIVLVESPSYFVFLELLKGLGVKAVSLPMKPDGGIDGERLPGFIDDLRSTGDLDRVRLLYVMGTYANPSTRCLSEGEKAALLEVLRPLERPIPVVEDMAYRELYFDQPFPARSLLAIPEWEDYPVIYAGTFTKPFATGLKVGFMVSRNEEALTTLAKIKGHQDFGTAHMNQAIIEHVLKTGAYTDHLGSIREHYRLKRDLLEEALIENGFRTAGWKWNQPTGGLLLWARGPEGTDTRLGTPFYERCVKEEILYVPGDLCFAEGSPWNCVRLSFGALESELIPEAARRFCKAAGH